jgi:putative copper resistance protein D
VTVTGLVNAWLRLQSWTAVVSTGYGGLVLAKTGCLLLLALLGGLARRRLAAGRLPVLRWAGWEVATMAVTLGLAATLSQTA